MRVWNGTMTTNEFTADVQVYIIKQFSCSLDDWYGFGIVKSSESFEPKEYQTNLGDIVITRISYDDGITFNFQGRGELNL
ncbi:hypothetical protein JT05_01645 [Desulfosporosinus sp. Tol-M]|nr:hypothetical protein JT05_01645 [Desulfosporosinus sp. Tol-M]